MVGARKALARKRAIDSRNRPNTSRTADIEHETAQGYFMADDVTQALEMTWAATDAIKWVHLENIAAREPSCR